MKTNDFKQTSDNCTQFMFFKDQLIESIEDLFNSRNIDAISDIINDSSFYVANPDYAKELDKDKLTEILIDQIALLAGLSKIYSSYENLNYFKNKK